MLLRAGRVSELVSVETRVGNGRHRVSLFDKDADGAYSGVGRRDHHICFVARSIRALLSDDLALNYRLHLGWQEMLHLLQFERVRVLNDRQRVKPSFYVVCGFF